MRKPDAIETRTHKGLNVEVRMWCNPTEFLWDGDCELDKDEEGWDCDIELILVHDEHMFKGTNSLCGCWGNTAYIKSMFWDELFPGAWDDLEDEIRKAASGIYVRIEKEKQGVALALINMPMV
jgi:hypothetical protein